MSCRIEETAKKVVDELLDHEENFHNTESYPTRCEDSVQVLDGCSKILKGSYRKNEIAQKIDELKLNTQGVIDAENTNQNAPKEIDISCPSCSFRMSVVIDKIPKVLVCPNCNTELRIVAQISTK